MTSNEQYGPTPTEPQRPVDPQIPANQYQPVDPTQVISEAPVAAATTPIPVLPVPATPAVPAPPLGSAYGPGSAQLFGQPVAPVRVSTPVAGNASPSLFAANPYRTADSVHSLNDTPSEQSPVAPAVAATPKKKKSQVAPIALSAFLAAVLATAGTTGLLLGPLSDQLGTDSSTQASTQDSSFTSSSQQTQTVSSDGTDWQNVTAAVSASVVAITVTTTAGESQGSGVIIDAEGHILTNNHVVEDGADGTITVTLDDGTLYEAEITGLDAATDLAVIQLVNAPTDLTVATFADSSEVSVGQSVMAMGNPLGLSQTATTGIVSALNRPVTTAETSDGTLVVTNAIQIDAAINPGNSGGPLFNTSGEVIGITSSIATLSSSTTDQTGSIGLGFAISSNLAVSIGQQLIDNGVAEHAFLGVSMIDGTATVDGVSRTGAQVMAVTEGSPASEAGLEVDDVIVTINGESVTGSESLTGFVRELSAGDTVTLGVVRNGELVEITATLAQKEEVATSVEEDSTQDSESTVPDSGSSNQGESTVPGSDSTLPNNIPELGGQQYPGSGN